MRSKLELQFNLKRLKSNVLCSSVFYINLKGNCKDETLQSATSDEDKCKSILVTAIEDVAPQNQREQEGKVFNLCTDCQRESPLKIIF